MSWSGPAAREVWSPEVRPSVLNLTPCEALPFQVWMSSSFGAVVFVSPRQVYVDGSRPELVDGFTRKPFTAMIEGVRQPALAAGLIDSRRFDDGIHDLLRTTDPTASSATPSSKPQQHTETLRTVGCPERDRCPVTDPRSGRERSWSPAAESSP